MWKQEYYEELYHHGVKGMKWGVRKDRDIRSRSSAYDVRKGEWTREPDGGSIAKQMSVDRAKSRIALTRGADRKLAKEEYKRAKKDLADGYKEYQAYAKDMHRKYGRSKQYVYDYDKKTYVNPKTGKSIKDYEYIGVSEYEKIKHMKYIINKQKVATGMGYVTAALSVIGAAKVIYDKVKR